MNKLILFTCLLLLNLQGFSQNWYKVSPLASDARIAASAFSLNGKGYITLGNSSSGSSLFFNDLWEYDPINDTWTQKANFPGISRNGAASFVINGKAYVGAGGNESIGLKFKDFYEYNPLSNSWSKKNDFPGSARYLGISFAINDKGYFGTGHPGLKKDFWEYNPATDSWRQKADFIGGPRQSMAYFTIGNKGYAGTGYNSSGTVDFYEYDPLQDKWTQKANFGGLPRYGAVGFTLNGKGYIGTGGTGSIFYKDFWSYNPTSNAWEPIDDFASIERYHSAAFVIDDIAYVGTGGNNSTSYNTFWKFSPFPLSVKNELIYTNVKIFPNPTSDNLNIHIENNERKDYNLFIYNSNGALLVNSILSNNKALIDLSNLAKGTYIIQINDGPINLTSRKIQIIR